MARVENYHFMHIENKYLRFSLTKFCQYLLPKREFFPNMIPFGGSQWFCLTKECIQYIIHFINS
jgi:hypothetical protein